MSKIYYPECWVVLKPLIEGLTQVSSPVVFNAVPLSVSIERNSYNKADSFSITVDARTLPITPAMIRAMSIEVYLFHKPSMQPIKELVVTHDQNVFLDSVLSTRPAIVGLVDEVSAAFGEDGWEVTIDGQDYTALFLEHTIDERKNFYGQRLDVALTALMKEVDVAGNMSLVVETDIATTLLPRVGVSLGKTNKNGFPIEKGKTTYWEYMYQLAVQHGFILFVRNLELVLASPGSVTDISKNDTSRQFSLSWGKNVSELTLQRSMGKETVPQIIVSCYNEDQRKTIVGKYPAKPVTKVTGVNTKKAESLNLVLRGIKDPALLTRAAKAYFDLIARTEQAITVTTQDLTDDDDKSLLYITAGDQLALHFASYNKGELRDVFESEFKRHLLVNGSTDAGAAELAAGAKLTDTFREPFYVRQASIHWTAEDGFDLTIDAVNLVVAETTRETADQNKPAENR